MVAAAARGSPDSSNASPKLFLERRRGGPETGRSGRRRPGCAPEKRSMPRRDDAPKQRRSRVVLPPRNFRSLAGPGRSPERGPGTARTTSQGALLTPEAATGENAILLAPTRKQCGARPGVHPRRAGRPPKIPETPMAPREGPAKAERISRAPQENPQAGPARPSIELPAGPCVYPYRRRGCSG